MDCARFARRRAARCAGTGRLTLAGRASGVQVPVVFLSAWTGTSVLDDEVVKAHRLDVENVLHPAVGTRAEIRVALEGEAVEIADRVLQLLGEVRRALGRRIVAGSCAVRVRLRLLGLRGSAAEQRGRKESREFEPLLVQVPRSCSSSTSQRGGFGLTARS